MELHCARTQGETHCCQHKFKECQHATITWKEAGIMTE